MYIWDAQRECKFSDEIVANYGDMFESRISAGPKEKLPIRASGKLDAEIISSWSYDTEGHAEKCGQQSGYIDVFERNVYGHPSAGLLWERQFEKV